MRPNTFLPRRGGRRDRRQSRGQALAEFALVSVVLTFLLATVFDFARVFYAQITVENAARAGALVAAQAPAAFTGTDCSSTNTATDAIGCAVQNESRGSAVTVTAAQITVTCKDFSGNVVSPCPSAPTTDVRSDVHVSSSLPLLTPLMQVLFGSSLPVGASALSDQQAVPTPDASYVPPTPSPTATPAPTATPTPTPAPTATPTATPTTSPCLPGQAPVPDLVTGANGAGTTETVSQARTEWATAGFGTSQFNPSSGSTNKTVTGQYADAAHTQVLTPGTCQSTTISVYVTYQ